MWIICVSGSLPLDELEGFISSIRQRRQSSWGADTKMSQMSPSYWALSHYLLMFSIKLHSKVHLKMVNQKVPYINPSHCRKQMLRCWPWIPSGGDKSFCLGRNEINCWCPYEVPKRHPLRHTRLRLLHDYYCDVFLPVHVFLVNECCKRKEAAQSIDEDNGVAGHGILVSSFLTKVCLPEISILLAPWAVSS